MGPEQADASTVSSAPGGTKHRPRSGQAGRFLRELVWMTLVEPVRRGRLRDEGWPYGLRAMVVGGYVGFAVAAVMVVAAGPLRRHDVLVLEGTSGLGLPAAAVWPLVVLLTFAVAMTMVAALHGPWWVRLLALLFTLMVMSIWSLRASSTGLRGTVAFGVR